MASCKTTELTSSWREPDKEITLNKLNKILVVALFKDETSRRKAEDQMVTYLKGKGVVSYNYLNENFSKDNENIIREKVRIDGFDGVVVMRLLDVERDRSYIPGNISTYPGYYQSFGGYYFRNWPYYSNPGYYTMTQTYTVEVNVFSMREDKIIWTGVTETTNPDGVSKMTREIAKVVYQKMIDEGFISQ